MSSKNALASPQIAITTNSTTDYGKLAHLAAEFSASVETSQCGWFRELDW